MEAFWKCLAAGLVIAALPHIASANNIPRTSEGKPDLSGTYDITTATPVERSPRLGRLTLPTPGIEASAAARITRTRD